MSFGTLQASTGAPAVTSAGLAAIPVRRRRRWGPGSRASASPCGDDLSLPQIADAVGYGSPFAFAAAFRRHHGEPPGTWRQRERAAAETRLLTTHHSS
ncbi:helix-turn-helix domain-containing protein [Streptomyces sp. NPDC048665]|uniref:helix-turn-helix domain-containing protein n=1 Tax=Streptomyces sp. NPDC048665 TaxID=3155490 RepID=UPI003445D404